jgi:hypothetical protein
MDAQKLTIPRDSTSMTLYIKYDKDGQTLRLKEPTYTANESDINMLVSGDLSKGGTIGNSLQTIVMNLACQPFKKSKTDIGINLHFETSNSISLFFSKECDTVEEIQEYFSVLYAIYWTLLLLLVAFVVIILYFYLKKNEITLFELYDKARDYLQNKIYSARGLSFTEQPPSPYYDNSLKDEGATNKDVDKGKIAKSYDAL